MHNLFNCGPRAVLLQNFKVNIWFLINLYQVNWENNNFSYLYFIHSLISDIQGCIYHTFASGLYCNFRASRLSTYRIASVAKKRKWFFLRNYDLFGPFDLVPRYINWRLRRFSGLRKVNRNDHDLMKNFEKWKKNRKNVRISLLYKFTPESELP